MPQRDYDTPQRDYDINASVRSTGPYRPNRPNGRWWTRPNFGFTTAGGAFRTARSPLDRNFRPWEGTGARPKEYQ